MTQAMASAERTAKVRLERGGDAVRVIRLTDPARRNAIDRQVRDELAAAAATVAADAEARVLVVTADGPAFSSGADLVDTFDRASERTVEGLRADLRRIYASFLAVRDLEIPTIAAVRGAAIGAGLNLALSCDLRLASRDATFGALFSRIGLHPGGGCSYFLSRALGPQRALRILLDGETLDATTALESGLVDQIVDDPEAAALETAARWARLDADLSRDIKRSIRLAVESGFDAAVEFESWAQAASARRPRIQQVVDDRRAKGAQG
jgi:enoyl-CoA hydratase